MRHTREKALLTNVDCFGFILFPQICNVIGQWVVRVGGTQKGLDGEENCPDL